MFKKLVVSSVAGAALSLASIGVASAATTASPSGGAHPGCSKAAAALQRIATRESKVAAAIPKLQAAELKAGQHHRTGLVTLDQDRLAVANQLKVVLTARAGRIEAVCHLPAAATSSTPGPTTS